MEKYTNLKGTRDFLPTEMLRRNYLFDTISDVFRTYGFSPIETPAMEHLSTLTGKYGDEGDKLLFKILNSGNFLDGVTPSEDYKEMTRLIAEKGLRYDLTVPFARFVVQHRNDITFPFKRYQIQPVWRADRPQKGRYREFFQCDVDVIGSDSLLNEVELIQIVDDIFGKLDISVTLKLNNRKILAGIAEYMGHPDKLTDITVAIDKLDKIGIEKVAQELFSKGFTETDIEKLKPILFLKGNTEEKLSFYTSIFSDNETGLKGIEELQTVFALIKNLHLNITIEFDSTLARGLSYYTGTIFEVKANDTEMGSICGGGRYDDLTGIFGVSGLSGVGISFGADRIYDVMLTLNKFPENLQSVSKVMIVNFGENELSYCMKCAALLRKNNIATEIYPENAKMKKQMGYADAKKIPFVIFIGENEIQTETVSLKDMQSGKQQTIALMELVRELQGTSSK